MEVDNFPNYLIYPDGKVWSKKRNKFIKDKIEKNGYKRIQLYKNKKRKYFYIHRLLGIHYLPNPENKYSIDHINRNKSDNRIENLRWATQKEQCENREQQCLSIKNTSGHTGIYYHNDSKKWVYRKVGKYKIMKYFKSKIDALCFKYIYLLKIKSGIIINGRN